VLLFVVRIFSGLTSLDVSAVGHLTAIVTAVVCVPFLARGEIRWPGRRWRGLSRT
jgi:membrane associated rhomboid family serine protease